MGKNWDKFVLLMWKNWTLQYRKPIQTLIEIAAPVIFSILLVVIRSLVDPEMKEPMIYPSFCTIPLPVNDSQGMGFCPNYDDAGSSKTNANFSFGEMGVVYSPKTDETEQIMSYIGNIFKHVQGLDSAEELEDYFVTNATNVTFAGIQFPDEYRTKNISGLKDLSITIRFPGETRLNLDPFDRNNWRTNLVFPVFQVPGPRQPYMVTGAAPSYYKEGFLAAQQFITYSLILWKNNVASDDISSITKWLLDNQIPFISMRRFPFGKWSEDVLLTALKSMLGTIIMLSFVYSCINTVKSITTEKEKQLKESMKIMGLPNWLHWLAWFLKCFIFLMISVILMVVLLKVKWYSNTDYTVFTHTNPLVLLLFLMFYMCATITFCFALSVFFSKANTASTVAGLVWFLQFFPFLFMQQNYDTLSLSTKLFASLGSNSAMGFGFQIMLMYEGTGEGLQWDNIFTPNSPDDTLTLGHIIMMMIIDTILYLLIALYFEAIFPGDYGVPQPWYFPVTSTYWCGSNRNTSVEDSSTDSSVFEGEFFEKEPQSLHAGIQIRKLRKVFGTNAAVRNLSLNMYENQITVLLGHNGAGKTTTMSMLTGMYIPTSGTAKINGYDIRTNMDAVRDSLGLCPQHNIIFDELTVEEHLYFFSKLKGLNNSEIKSEINKYIDLLELQPKRNAKSATLSGGMKRKLCVGMALCGNSKVVMLDEPTAGMDPGARRALWNLLQQQKDGRTMLLTTHFMDEADLLGDRIAIMAGGELQCCGSSFFLKKKYGAGYSLIMEKSRECDAGKVTHLLRKHIPDIEIHSNVGSELTYLLAENQSSVFEQMLSNLEENCTDLGIRSYGISLTTLEEVFMKVGADHGQEELYNDGEPIKDYYKSPISNGDFKVNINKSPAMSKGMNLIVNHFMAMVLKKFLSTIRSWLLFLIQTVIPALFLGLSIVISRNQNRTGNLPAMPLDLSKFTDSVTLVENDDTTHPEYLHAYGKYMNDSGYHMDGVDNMTETMIRMSELTPITVRRKYIIGATFAESLLPTPKAIPNITAWFNNDPYHSPGVSLATILNSIYKKVIGEENVLRFINHPLPYTAKTQINQILNGQSMGFQIAFNAGFSMAFVTSFYVLFIVRENISKSKHLQIVSGVKIWVFWLTHFLCDMATYLIGVILFIITLIGFQEDGYKTAADLGRVFVIYLYFGCAFLPMFYLASYLFEIPSTGYTRMTLFSVFAGNAAFLVVTILSNEALNLSHIGKALHWVFLLFPQYSLSSGLNENYKQYSFNYICKNILELCMKEGHGHTREECIAMQTAQIEALCKDTDDHYFKWEAPGIGRNLVFSFIEGAVLFAILLLIEYEIFAKMRYFIEQKLFQKYPVDVTDEDSDVAEQKDSIRNSSEAVIKSNYILALKDLTKYYKNFLAVNGLSLGVKKYECFGLLGVNGAGKTTTFKMMSGDESISYGDGWVNGYSIKSELKEVQKYVGYCPQFDALLDDMTANETIKMFCLLRGIQWNDTDLVAEYLSKEFDFTRHLNKKVKELSGGNKRKLSAAISLIGDPPVLYLDEPTTGMDPATKRYLWNALCKIRDNGKCIVLTSHSMEECEALCTRIAIMVNGNFKCLGSTQHLKNKFAAGYTLTIKVKKLPDSSGMQHSDTAPIEEFIHQNFPSANLREKHQELITFYITDTSVSWSKMFGILEQAKRQNLNIEDYSLGQSSLEQVFLTFTKQQN